MSAPTIIIERVSEGFAVRVDPIDAAAAVADAPFATHKDAYGFACGLRMTIGGRIDDRSGFLGLSSVGGLRG
jgi:hypothetical protein